MYAKIFRQIFDGSLRENPEARFTFMDLLILAEVDGVVDMTPEAISARTNRPIELIRKTLTELESPDPRSRTPDQDGRRIVRLDEHRDWGWRIVNYHKFRATASDEQRREHTRERTRKWRETKKLRPVTHGDACDAMQRQKQRQKQKQVPPLSPVGGNGGQTTLFELAAGKLPPQYANPRTESAWDAWQKHRIEKRHKLTPETIKRQINLLQDWGPDRWIEAIYKSITNGWIGLFPPNQIGPPADMDSSTDGYGRPNF